MDLSINGAPLAQAFGFLCLVFKTLLRLMSSLTSPPHDKGCPFIQLNQCSSVYERRCQKFQAASINVNNNEHIHILSIVYQISYIAFGRHKLVVD